MLTRLFLPLIVLLFPFLSNASSEVGNIDLISARQAEQIELALSHMPRIDSSNSVRLRAAIAEQLPKLNRILQAQSMRVQVADASDKVAFGSGKGASYACVKINFSFAAFLGLGLDGAVCTNAHEVRVLAIQPFHVGYDLFGAIGVFALKTQDADTDLFSGIYKCLGADGAVGGGIGLLSCKTRNPYFEQHKFLLIGIDVGAGAAYKHEEIELY